jgi:hypothetical protein
VDGGVIGTAILPNVVETDRGGTAPSAAGERSRSAASSHASLKRLDPTARPRSGLGKIVGTICFLQEAKDQEISCERVVFFPGYLDFVFRSGGLARDLAKPRAEPVGRVKP